jgi:phosphate uptake regulator
VDAALIGRYYERFADHAVAIARRVYLSHCGHPERSLEASRAGEQWMHRRQHDQQA